VQAEFVQPTRCRQQEPALDEHQHRPEDRTMAGETQMRGQPAIILAAGQLGKEQRVMIARLDRAAQNPVHRRVDLGVAIFGRGAVRQETLAPRPAHLVFDPAHHVVNLDRHYLLRLTR
jgi:hypothetical protein